MTIIRNYDYIVRYTHKKKKKFNLFNSWPYIKYILGAEPSPAYFNIMMYNNREAIMDGTQLAADWTFSGLQKFGQGLLDKLRGLKLPHPLLEKVNNNNMPCTVETHLKIQLRCARARFR